MFTIRVRWIDVGGRFRLTQSPRPRGAHLEEDLQDAKARGVDVIVSLLTDEDVKHMGLERQEEVAGAIGIETIRFPIVDHNVPSDVDATLALADQILVHLEAGRGVMVHCYAGIGRSGLVVITTLVRAGFELEDAVRRASLARNIPVPETKEQAEWLEKYARPPDVSSA